MTEPRFPYNPGGGVWDFMVTQAQVDMAETRETVPSGIGGLYEFHGTLYDTAHDKVLWWKQFQRFVTKGWQRDHFTRRVYKGLSLNLFGHIAEFSEHGFYGSWFSTPQQRARWVEYVIRGGAFGFKSDERKDLWGDVERAVVEWLTKSGWADRIRIAAVEQQHTEDMAEYERLHAKLYPEV